MDSKKILDISVPPNFFLIFSVSQTKKGSEPTTDLYCKKLLKLKVKIYRTDWQTKLRPHTKVIPGGDVSTLNPKSYKAFDRDMACCSDFFKSL